MNDADRIGFLETNLARQIAWISAADSKISFVFAIDTAMLGVLAAVAPKSACDWTVAPAILVAFAALLGLASLVFLCVALLPITHGPRDSLVFFGGIVQRDASQFRKAVGEMTAESQMDDLCAQCHRNAEIADRKYVWVQRAMMALYVSIRPWVWAIYLFYRKAG